MLLVWNTDADLCVYGVATKKWKSESEILIGKYGACVLGFVFCFYIFIFMDKRLGVLIEIGFAFFFFLFLWISGLVFFLIEIPLMTVSLSKSTIRF